MVVPGLKLLVPRALMKLLYRHLGTSRLGPTLHRLFSNPSKCLKYSILFCKIIRAWVFRSYDSSYDLEMIQQESPIYSDSIRGDSYQLVLTLHGLLL
jgi:hypothetical protein